MTTDRITARSPRDDHMREGKALQGRELRARRLDRDPDFVLALAARPNGPIFATFELWWRRGELNPCPRSFLRKLLHAYPMVSFKGPNVAPAHCRPPSVREIPSPLGAVTPPND